MTRLHAGDIEDDPLPKHSRACGVNPFGRTADQISQIDLSCLAKRVPAHCRVRRRRTDTHRQRMNVPHP